LKKYLADKFGDKVVMYFTPIDVPKGEKKPYELKIAGKLIHSNLVKNEGPILFSKHKKWGKPKPEHLQRVDEAIVNALWARGNMCWQYPVSVPRQVRERVPRTVTYIDYESRLKQVPYTVNRSERRILMQTEEYQVPVSKYNGRTEMETRKRQVPVPYQVNIPETKYRTVIERVPIQRAKVEMDDVMRTVYDTQIRTRCVPEYKIVEKQTPVYNGLIKPDLPSSFGNPCGGYGQEPCYGQSEWC